MSAPPPIRTEDGRALLDWVRQRIRDLDVDEMSTSDRGRLDAFRAVRTHLEQTVPYIEAGAICLISPGVSYPSAMAILEMYDERREPSEPAA